MESHDNIQVPTGDTSSAATEVQKKGHQSGKPLPRSPFTTGTVELVLHFLPVEASPDERRIRHMLSLNGKTLAVGTQRASDLPALFASLSGLSPEDILAHLEEYVTQRQRQVKECESQRGKKPAQPAPSASMKTAEAQRTLPGVNAATRSEATSLIPSQPRTAFPTKPTASSHVEEAPQQLSLF